MTADASWSCLGLATSVGSTIRQIVDARVLPTAAVPPALPGISMSSGSLAPPLDAITRLSRSAHRRRHEPGDGRGDDIGRLAAAGEFAIARAQSELRLPGDLADQLGLALLPEQQVTADPGREAVGPGRLDQQPASRVIAGFGDAAASDAGTAGMLTRHQPEIGHELARIGEA